MDYLIEDRELGNSNIHFCLCKKGKWYEHVPSSLSSKASRVVFLWRYLLSSRPMGTTLSKVKKRKYFGC
jgi:hypothetical protein